MVASLDVCRILHGSIPMTLFPCLFLAVLHAKCETRIQLLITLLSIVVISDIEILTSATEELALPVNSVHEKQRLKA